MHNANTAKHVVVVATCAVFALTAIIDGADGLHVHLMHANGTCADASIENDMHANYMHSYVDHLQRAVFNAYNISDLRSAFRDDL